MCDLICPTSTHVLTLYVYVDNTVRMYELDGAQLKQLITLPAFPGDPRQIVMEAARPALVVKKYDMDELWMSNADGETWTAWRLLAHSPTDKLDVRSLCMPTPNMLLVCDDNSHSVMQYDLA